MTKKTRIKKQIKLPPTRPEMETLVGEIRDMTIQLLSIQADREHKIQAIDERFGKLIDPIKVQLEEKTELVQQWADANPDEFAKRKSLELTHGTIGFRTGTPSLKLLSRKFNWKKALELVESFLPAFVRRVPEINKEAIIARRNDETLLKALPMVGLKIDQGESFFIDPKMDDIASAALREAA